ncbi:MAG: ABC transporter ATP-binding protein [Proteobacteria bacterium]|nr:ABC transporter ATP-binding protein [Pseudomonadota bacterium]
MNQSLTDTVLKLTNVSAYYGFTKAIESVSFELKKGQVVGLIGANGAGKTTSLKVLLGMLKPATGTISILGMSRCSSRLFKRIGFAPEDATPPEYLTAREYLVFLSKFRKGENINSVQQIEEFLTWFELDPDKLVRKYSKGMRRRLILAQAFLGKPDLIVLDEPLNGLDPMMILKLRDRLKLYQKQGTTILYSSHILTELEQTCSDVVIMHRGSVIHQDSVENLVKQFGSVEKAFSAKIGAA